MELCRPPAAESQTDWHKCAIVGIDIERLADFHLLDVDAFADADFVAGRGGVDGVLDVREARIRTLNFIVIHDQPSAVSRQGHGWPNER
jgi:hypothetical protein